MPGNITVRRDRSISALLSARPDQKCSRQSAAKRSIVIAVCRGTGGFGGRIFNFNIETCSGYYSFAPTISAGV